MQDLMLRIWVYAQTLPERMQEERGQASVEYLAVGAFIVAIGAALLTYKTTIAGEISKVLKAAIDAFGSTIGGGA